MLDAPPAELDVAFDRTPERLTLTLSVEGDALPSEAELVVRGALLGCTLGVAALVHDAPLAHTLGPVLALCAGLAASVLPWPGARGGAATLTLVGPEVVVRTPRRRRGRPVALAARGLRWRIEEGAAPFARGTRTLVLWSASGSVVLRRLRGTRAALEGALEALVAPAARDPRLGRGAAEVPLALLALRGKAR